MGVVRSEHPIAHPSELAANCDEHHLLIIYHQDCRVWHALCLERAVSLRWNNSVPVTTIDRWRRLISGGITRAAASYTASR